jgi:hypothetical protein
MPYIILSLTYICNESLAQGIFLHRLKYAVVKPILKNGDVIAVIIFQII